MLEERFKNKLSKFYWEDCVNSDGSIDFSKISDDQNFTNIPENSKGYIRDFSVGNLRDIVSESFNQGNKFGREDERKKLIEEIKERLTDKCKFREDKILAGELLDFLNKLI